MRNRAATALLIDGVGMFVAGLGLGGYAGTRADAFQWDTFGIFAGAGLIALAVCHAGAEIIRAVRRD